MIVLHFLAPLFALAAFVLSLLPAISTSAAKSITLFKAAVNANAIVNLIDAEADVDLSFGVWGYCISSFNVTASIRGQDVGNIKGAAYCSVPKGGYTFDDEFSELINQVPGIDLDTESLRDSISHATAAAAALHVIVTAFAFITLLISLSTIFRRNVSRLACCSLLIVIFTVIITTVAFLLDVILVAVLRNRVTEFKDLDVAIAWGNAPWLMLGATIAMWLAVIGACSDRCCVGRKKYEPVSNNGEAQRGGASWEMERMKASPTPSR